MLGALLGTAAKAAVTGAAGLAVIGVLKEAKVGDTLRTVAVTLTEVGVRGYKLVENGVEKVADVATDVFTEAKGRVDEAEASADAESAAADAVVEEEVVIVTVVPDEPESKL